jgi:hypothetical protein
MNFQLSGNVFLVETMLVQCFNHDIALQTLWYLLELDSYQSTFYTVFGGLSPAILTV